ncbi:MAG: hypothetical protein V4719_02195 [Planctomycetota bacterium]
MERAQTSPFDDDWARCFLAVLPRPRYVRGANNDIDDYVVERL